MTERVVWRFQKHWKEFSKEENDQIEKEREETKKSFKKEDGEEFGLICKACSKPNRLAAKNCTACVFDLHEHDIVKLPKNVFLDILEGRNTDTPILFRDEKVCVFDDKYPVAVNHTDVIPIEVIVDISDLRTEHIELLEHMYQKGVEEFKKRNLEQYKKYNIEDLIASGFNYPVSVKHLHLHMVLPPFQHKKCFGTSRWHSFPKVMNDLKKYGKVRLYKDFPDEDEVKYYHQKYHEKTEWFK